MYEKKPKQVAWLMEFHWIDQIEPFFYSLCGQHLDFTMLYCCEPPSPFGLMMGAFTEETAQWWVIWKGIFAYAILCLR